jgi:ankyrin repeat protein
MKTMSESEKYYVPNRITAIFKILLKHGWIVNDPLEKSGGTILHQAVAFWTGSYTWDLNLRTAMVSFLCEHGADPFQVNAEGKSPYDVALASGHQDLLLVLNRGSRGTKPDGGLVEPVEIFSEIENLR